MNRYKARKIKKKRASIQGRLDQKERMRVWTEELMREAARPIIYYNTSAPIPQDNRSFWQKLTGSKTHG